MRFHAVEHGIHGLLAFFAVAEFFFVGVGHTDRL
jgi:hypothetical protein